MNHEESKNNKIGKAILTRLFSVVFYLLILDSCLLIPAKAQTAEADPVSSNSSAASDLQIKIDRRNADIQALEKEIAGYQAEINNLGNQADSLSAAIKILDLTEKRLRADIRLTRNKIAAKNIQIRELGSQISGKESAIADDQGIISHSLSLISQSDSQSLAELLLSGDSISDALNSLDQLGTLGKNLIGRINDIRAAKANLETNKRATEAAKKDLTELGKQLNDQRQVAINAAAEKNALLQSTKQSQSQYAAALSEKRTLKDAFEREVLDYESQLHLNVSAASIPHTGSGVLSWPLEGIYPGECPSPSGNYASCITQYFGNTPFATANSQIYSGRGHNGVDFRASIGTPVKAALSGTVVGVANTDIIPGCYSYGKWVMVKHPNGLSTLYAHMSVQSVGIGEIVATGQIIGYSGNTGYTTGPHLHFGVYATQGVKITTFDNSVNCKGAIVPLADFRAYLNPLSYL